MAGATLDNVVADLKVVISGNTALQEAIVASQKALMVTLNKNSKALIGALAGNQNQDGPGNPLANVIQPAAAQQANSGYGPGTTGATGGGGSSTGGGTGGTGGGSGSGGGGGAANPTPANQPNPANPTPAGQPGPGVFGRMKAAMGAGKGGTNTGSAVGYGALIRDAYKHFVQENENAARYQGMEGGTTRFDGAKERAREVGWAATQRFVHPNGMTAEESRQAFSDVTSLGFRDDPKASGQAGISRHAALDFMQRNKVNMGMSGDESTQVLGAMTQNASTNLNDLSDALHQVGKAAGEANVNATQVRESFLRMFQVWSSVGAGQGAVSLAANSASSLARYGRDMQSVDQNDQASPGFQYRAASQANMTIGRYQNTMRTDPGKIQGILDKNTTMQIEQLLGNEQVSWIKSRANEAPYAGKIKDNPDLLQALAEEWQQKFQDQINLLSMQTVIEQATGTRVQEYQVPKWVVGHVLGINASGEKSVSVTGSQAVTTGKDGKITSTRTGQAVDPGSTFLAKGGSGNTGQESTGKDGKALNKGQQAYYDLAHSEGKPANYHEPVIEALLSKVQDPDKAKVIVKTEEGKKKLVSLSEAIQYFPNEIARGDIVFAEGKYKDTKGKEKDLEGAGFSDVTGMAGDTARSAADEYGRHVEVGKDITDDKKYKDLLDPDKAAGDKVGKDKDGVYKFELSSSAQKLLRLVPPDSATAEDAANGTAPAAHHILSRSWREFMSKGY